ncbi:MAG: metalloregulator ArsR/SmtB family transcription factor [Armatimonadetes bacterium]|nr:metalloregulator ArsR/SmtB family transcription factor [Armatimonadota bacterium]
MTTDLVRLLKALADPTRVRIVHLLRGRDELCVCELVDALDIPQYSVSRHLGVLKAAGLLTDWRQGKWMHYRLDPDLSKQDRAVVVAVCARVEQETTARRDRRRLEQSLRPREEGGMIQCP